MKQKIKIWFTDFWASFDPYNNYFTSVLSKHFDLFVNPDPDFLIHSVYDKNYLKYKCKRICFTGENTRPNFDRSDYHIGFDFNTDKRYLRWPLYLLYKDPECLVNREQFTNISSEKTRFSAFVVSNEKATERIEFFKKLSEYKKVDSGGRIFNNLGYRVENKIEFLRKYKFTIAFENSAHPGYTTEKIIEPFLARSLPIYWGNSLVEKDFNPNSFINANNFSNTTELIEHIKEVDNNQELFESYLKEPPFRNDSIPNHFKEDNLIDFFRYIFSAENSKKSVAKRTDFFFYYNYSLRKKIFQLRKKIRHD